MTDQSRQSSGAETEQPTRGQHVPLRLDQCGDTLTVTDLCAVLQISRSQYYSLTRHRAFPIKPLPSLGVTRYAKVAVERFLSSGGALLRKAS